MFKLIINFLDLVLKEIGKNFYQDENYAYQFFNIKTYSYELANIDITILEKKKKEKKDIY